MVRRRRRLALPCAFRVPVAGPEYSRLSSSYRQLTGPNTVDPDCSRTERDRIANTAWPLSELCRKRRTLAEATPKRSQPFASRPATFDVVFAGPDGLLDRHERVEQALSMTLQRVKDSVSSIRPSDLRARLSLHILKGDPLRIAVTYLSASPERKSKQATKNRWVRAKHLHRHRGARSENAERLPSVFGNRTFRGDIVKSRQPWIAHKPSL